MQEIRMCIEKLSRKNFDHFVVLLKRSRESDRTHYLDTTTLNRLKEEAFSINPKYETYLAKIGLDWVAYVIIIMSYSTFMALPTLSVDEIFVLDNFRDLGIGMAMFDFCVRIAKKRGCGKIELAVANWNKKAKKFFASNRAVPTDMTCYQIGLLDTKIGKPRKSKLSRLNSRVNSNRRHLKRSFQ